MKEMRFYLLSPEVETFWAVFKKYIIFDFLQLKNLNKNTVTFMVTVFQEHRIF